MRIPDFVIRRVNSSSDAKCLMSFIRRATSVSCVSSLFTGIGMSPDAVSGTHCWPPAHQKVSFTTLAPSPGMEFHPTETTQDAATVSHLNVY